MYSSLNFGAKKLASQIDSELPLEEFADVEEKEI